MKTLKKPFHMLLSIGLLGLTFILSSNSLLQESSSSSLKDFNIIIKKTNDGLHLTGKNGSAWLELSFSADYGIPHMVDEYGSTRRDQVSTLKDPNLADFLFAITKTRGGIQLKGIEGTAWTELSFSLRDDQEQEINQLGMVAKE